MKKAGRFYIVKFTFVIAAFIIAISVSNLTFGGTKDSTAKANTIKTITMGINSSIPGIAQSCIYLVGYYAFPWAVDPLINILNDNSKDPLLRILAAYSLNMIADEKGFYAIETVSIHDENHLVQGVCSSIYDNYINRQNQVLSISK